MNPDAVVVAAGCYVQAAAEEAAADEAIDIIIGNNQKKRSGKYTGEFQKRRKVKDRVLLRRGLRRRLHLQRKVGKSGSAGSGARFHERGGICGQRP